MTDALALSGEASTGVLGIAARADLTYRPNATSSYRLGLREDRTRVNDHASTARRGVSFGADRKINDAWYTNWETVVGGVTDWQSMTNTYGVTYTPNDAHTYSFGLLSGQTRESDGTNVTRKGLSLSRDDVS